MINKQIKVNSFKHNDGAQTTTYYRVLMQEIAINKTFDIKAYNFMFYFFQFSCYDLYMYVYNALGIGTLREICYFLKVGQ